MSSGLLSLPSPRSHFCLCFLSVLLYFRLCKKRYQQNKATPFVLVKATGVDMFPQTDHVEMVGQLVRLNGKHSDELLKQMTTALAEHDAMVKELIKAEQAKKLQEKTDNPKLESPQSKEQNEHQDQVGE